MFEFGHVYDSDVKEKLYKREGTRDGANVEFSVPIISGARGNMHAFLEHFPSFDAMAI